MSHAPVPHFSWKPDPIGPIDCSLVIACYCEEPHLFSNVQALQRYFSATRLRYEFVFVEDASPDQTRREIERCQEWLVQKGVPIKVLFHETNQGRGATVTDGFRMAEGDAVGFIDIDLEHLMDCMLPAVLDLRDGKTDGVITSRVYDRSLFNLTRIVTSKVYKWLVQKILHLPVTDTESGLKFFNRKKILPVLDTVQDKHWFWDTEIVYASARAGLRLTNHPIAFVKNHDKKSTVRLARDSVRQLKALMKLWWRHQRKAKS